MVDGVVLDLDTEEQAAFDAKIADELANANVLVEERINNFLKEVDNDVDTIYADTVGNRTSEYMLAESDANWYKAATYNGNVPDSVQAWADATGKPAQWAADDILNIASQWRSAQILMRKERLAHKELARKAMSIAAVDPIAVSWKQFVVSTREMLEI